LLVGDEMIVTGANKDYLDEALKFVGFKCASIFVAGGAVVNVTGASDIDIWVGKDMDKVAHNTVCNLPYRVWAKNPDSYPVGGVGTKFIGQGYVPALGKIVQVIQHKFDNALDLMDTFDISTHQWAYTSRGQMVTGRSATPANYPPQILKWRAKTMERYIKICERYGHKVDLKVLEQWNDNTESLHKDPLKKKEKVHKTCTCNMCMSLDNNIKGIFDIETPTYPAASGTVTVTLGGVAGDSNTLALGKAIDSSGDYVGIQYSEGSGQMWTTSQVSGASSTKEDNPPMSLKSLASVYFKKQKS
jgi:hypothetical protein